MKTEEEIKEEIEYQKGKEFDKDDSTTKQEIENYIKALEWVLEK